MPSVSSQCRLLGPFLLIVQSVLGLLSLSSLLYKRYKEYPNRRPWRVWFFDVSKQVFGAIGIHFLNLLLSVLGLAPDEPGEIPVDIKPFSLRPTDNGLGLTPAPPPSSQPTGVHTISFYLRGGDTLNPCNWYFLNILFDTTIGVPILWALLYVIFGLANKAGIKGVKSGQYGVPPRILWYFKQLMLYFVGLFSMKLIVYMLLTAVPIFERIADWLLSVFDPVPDLQVFMVIFVTPLVMNSLQYILIDNIIQSPEYKRSRAVRIPDEEGSYEALEGLRGDIEREWLPEEGLLGQSEPETFEGELR